MLVRCGIADIPETRLCHLGFLGSGRYATIDVRDSGPGIPEEIREKIFKPFFSTKLKGRGFGLSAVLGIIRSHNGCLKVHSVEGDGTTVRVLLPVVPPS